MNPRQGLLILATAGLFICVSGQQRLREKVVVAKFEKYLNGTECGTQHTLQPYRSIHGPPINPIDTPLPFVLSVHNSKKKIVDKYVPGEVYTVQIFGHEYFRGLILQARLATRQGFIIGHLRGGRFIWEESWNEVGVKMLDCLPVYNNSITHSNWEIKTLLRVKWIADRSVGPVQFFFTIFHEKDIYWERVQPETGFLTPELKKEKVAIAENEGIAVSITGQKPPQNEELFHLPYLHSGEEKIRPKIRDTEKKKAVKLPEEPKMPELMQKLQSKTEKMLMELNGELPRVTVPSPQPSEPKATTLSPEDVLRSLYKTLHIPQNNFSLLRNRALAIQNKQNERDEEAKKETEKSDNSGEDIASSEPEPNSEPPAPEPTAEPEPKSEPSPEPTAEPEPEKEKSGSEEIPPEAEPKPLAEEAGAEPDKKISPPPLELEKSESEEVGAEWSEEEFLSNFFKGSIELPGTVREIEETINEDLKALLALESKEEEISAEEKKEMEEEEEKEMEEEEEKKMKVEEIKENGPKRLVIPKSIDITKDYCNPPPCYSGGTCRNLEPGDFDEYTDEDAKFVCECVRGWMGLKCETRDYCAENPCQKGVCVNEFNTHSCKCEPGWVGRNCDRDCPAHNCKNGGTCALDEGTGNLTCLCPPGRSGDRCEIDVNECINQPCLNGGTCHDLLNGYKCNCRKGYMGKNCHRPCQNIYKSCDVWEKQSLCEGSSNSTVFFRENCASSCRECVFDESTIRTKTPIPPVLEPFEFLIGVWAHNSTSNIHYPTDFNYPEGTTYYETLSFLITEVPMFGTPSINFTSRAVNNEDETDIQLRKGFLTIKPRPVDRLRAALHTTGNDGIIMMEEGPISRRMVELKAVKRKTYRHRAYDLPESSDREFELTSGYLRETIRKNYQNENAVFITKYFHKVENFLTS